MDTELELYMGEVVYDYIIFSFVIIIYETDPERERHKLLCDKLLRSNNEDTAIKIVSDLIEYMIVRKINFAICYNNIMETTLKQKINNWILYLLLKLYLRLEGIKE